MHLTISRGPAPVKVINLVHDSVGDAVRSLHQLGLRAVVRHVASPATSPGTVVGQAPTDGMRPRGSRVTLNVAEVPQWRTVTTFDGRSSDRALPMCSLADFPSQMQPSEKAHGTHEQPST